MAAPGYNGAPLPLLVPCFLARTRPLLCPAIHAAQHERAGRSDAPASDRLYHQRHLEYRQRRRPSYTVSPAGQPLKRSRPAVGAAQAVGCHMSKGQQAMAVAMIYPEPEDRGRGKKGSVAERFPEISKG